MTIGPDGIKFGRRHRFVIDWSGAIDVRNGDRVYKKTRLLFYTDADGEWEAKYMPETASTR